MKLAREIAEKVGSLRGSTWDEDPGWLALAETIIAAKLEPVREALRSAWAGEVCGPEMCCESPACKQVAEIWESLSEEVEDEKDTQTED